MDKDLLLCEILECGTEDLIIVNNCDYDISKVIEAVKERAEKVDLGGIAYGIEQVLKENLTAKINSKISEMEEKVNSMESNMDNLSDGEVEEMYLMKKHIFEFNKLNVYEDFELWFNYLDTHISCTANDEIYRKYFMSFIEEEEGESGLTIYID